MLIVHINQFFYNVNLLIKGKFVCVTTKRDPHAEEVLQVQKRRLVWRNFVKGAYVHAVQHSSTDAEGNR